MTGSELIAEKIRTNREHKGYTAKHDNKHDNKHDKGELYAAAVCYLDRAWLQIQQKTPLKGPGPLYMWPFEEAAWKSSDDPIRNLVHAGALIAAEIDRLQRRK